MKKVSKSDVQINFSRALNECFLESTRYPAQVKLGPGNKNYRAELEAPARPGPIISWAGESQLFAYAYIVSYSSIHFNVVADWILLILQR